MNPSWINDAARLAMAAERCGPHVLDDAESFEQVFRRDRFAYFERAVLDLARRFVKEPKK